jgi:hypothetical protein
VPNSVIQAAAGKAADRLDIGHIQAIENAAKRRLGAEVGTENFRLRTLGIREFALLCVGIRNRPAHPIDDALLCVGIRNSPPHLARPGPAGPLTR